MTNLIDIQPTEIVRRADSFVFYYGVKARHIPQLPAHAEFSVVYSPLELTGWEFVHYQVFEELNGLMVLEQRRLNIDEIAYLELIISTSDIEY